MTLTHPPTGTRSPAPPAEGLSKPGVAPSRRGSTLVGGGDRIAQNVPERRHLFAALRAEGARELAKLYLSVAIVASLVLIGIGSLGLGIGLAIRAAELAGGF